MPWTLTSHAKLAEAGYLYTGRVHCRKCGAPILLYRKAATGGRAMSVEPETFLPHRERCTAAPPAEAKRGQGMLF